MERNLTTYQTTKAVDVHDTTNFRGGEEYIYEKYFHGRLLDIGCGTGRTTVHLAKKFDVVGIDYAPAMIERAKQNHPSLSFEVMDVRKLEFEDETFDTAFFSFNGLDHLYPLQNRIQALREIHRVVKKGGIFAYDSNVERRKYPTKLRHIPATVYAMLKGVRAPYMVTFPQYGFFITYAAPVEEQLTFLQQNGFESVEHFRTKKNVEMFVTKRS